jgi:hypothetical protein
MFIYINTQTETRLSLVDGHSVDKRTELHMFPS